MPRKSKKKPEGGSLKFQNMAAQGDVLFRRIDALPEGVKPASAENGRFIIAHSETGHHHTVDVVPGVEMFVGADPMIAYLQVAEEGLASAVHQRSFHTHATVIFPKGIFELRRQREQSPEGWKRVAD
jgi:hypothetical protein